MVAWWAGGTLQQLQLFQLPAPSLAEITAENPSAQRAQILHDQLMQIAWAGELEGWLELPVKWHLVGDEHTIAEWQPLISEWGDELASTAPSVPRSELAKFSAQKGAHDELAANLVPPEYSVRYRQQYVDRIWMGSLGAIVVVYVLGALIYLVALNIYQYRQGRVQAQVISLGPTYTNVLQLKERAQVLQEQLNLKYAALDAFKITSELLPPDFTLNNLVFSRGRLQLYGIAPAGQETNVTSFNEQMRNATVSGRPLFKSVTPPTQSSRPGSPTVTWNFDALVNAID
jgi:hypothetical protein